MKLRKAQRAKNLLQAEEAKEEADTIREAQEEVSDEEAERKRQEYHERVKARSKSVSKSMASRKIPKAEQPTEEDENKRLLEELKREKQQRDLELRIQQAGNELKVLEDDFKTAYTDYDDVVNDALELTKFV